MIDIYQNHPSTIKNLYGFNIDNVCGFKNNNPEYSMINHFFYEFNNDPDIKILYAGLVKGKNGENLYSLKKDILISYLNSIYSPKKKILLDNLHEGNLIECLNLIYQIIEKIKFSSSQINLFTATLNSDELNNEYCRVNNIKNKINVYSCNSWEYAIKNNKNFNIEFNVKKKDKTFLCFNRMCREHRLALISLLYKENLIEKSYVSFYNNSFYTDDGSFEKILHYLKFHLSPAMYKEIHKNYYDNVSKFPLELNIPSWQTNQVSMQESDKFLFENSQFSLVTETFFFDTNKHLNFNEDNMIFFSEKIYKPILMKHPFILVGPHRSLEYLRKLGYKTFSPLIDETYDTIKNDEQRLCKIVDEVKRLDNFNDNQWTEWQTKIKDIVEYNFQVLKNRKKHEYAFTRPDYKTQYIGAK